MSYLIYLKDSKITKPDLCPREFADLFYIYYKMMVAMIHKRLTIAATILS